jgi:hypothetical protein
VKARTRIAALLLLAAAACAEACVGGQTGSDQTISSPDGCVQPGTQQVAPVSVRDQISSLTRREAQLTWSASTLQVSLAHEGARFDETATVTFSLVEGSCAPVFLRVTTGDDLIDDTFACVSAQNAGQTTLRCELRDDAYLKSKIRAVLAQSGGEPASAAHWLALRIDLFSSGSITLMDAGETGETLGSFVFDQEAIGP